MTIITVVLKLADRPLGIDMPSIVYVLLQGGESQACQLFVRLECLKIK